MVRCDVLVLCERSQVVTSAFLNKGYSAYSVDIADCYGSFPDRHFKMDAFYALNHFDPKLIIAHPPCTYLTKAANRMHTNSYWMSHVPEAISFFLDLWFASLRFGVPVCFENPAGIMSSVLRKPDQYIQPYEFGDPFSKKTGLWLHNLPPLQPTCVLARPVSGWQNQSFDSSGKNRGFCRNFSSSVVRSKTFPGIASAMAEQWGVLL